MIEDIEVIEKHINLLLAKIKKSDAKSDDIFKMSREYLYKLNNMRIDYYKKLAKGGDKPFLPYHFGEDEKFEPYPFAND